jgi:hypothetical protein
MTRKTWVLVAVAVTLLLAAAVAVRSHGGGFLARLAPAIHGH